MNCFLLLLILKLLTINWAAPIDLLEAKGDLQQDKEILENLVNNGLSVENNLIKTADDVINSTEIAYIFTALNKNLNDNVENRPKDLQNFTVGVEKEQDLSSNKETTEQSLEITTINQNNWDQVAAISTTDNGVPQKEIKQEEIFITTKKLDKSSIKHVEKVLLDFNISSYDNVVPTDAESTSITSHNLSSSTIGDELAVTENSNNLKTLNEGHTITDHIVTPANEEFLKDLVEISKNKTFKEALNHTEQNYDIAAATIASDTEQVLQYTENITEKSFQESKPEISTSDTQSILEIFLEQTTQDSRPETSISNIQSIVENILEQKTRDSKPEIYISNTQSIVENLHENVENLYNQSQQIINNVKNKATKHTVNAEPAENSTNNQNSTTVNKFEESFDSVLLENTVEEISSIPIEKALEKPQQNIDLVLASNNYDVAKQALVEEITIVNPDESTSANPFQKQTVDEFISQVADIGSTIEKVVEELKIDASKIQEAAESYSNPHVPIIRQENINETEVSGVEGKSTQASSFKQAVDSFVEDVLEIVRELGLSPEEKPTEQLKTTTESLSESVSKETTTAAEKTTDLKLQEVESYTPFLNTNFSSSIDHFVGKLDEIAINLDTNKTEKIDEIVGTTSASLENLNVNQETLVGAVLEFGNNFNKAVYDLFAVSESKPESATESFHVMLKKINTEEELNKLENSEISSTHNPLEISQEDSTYNWQVDHGKIAVSFTTSKPNTSLQYSPEEVKKTWKDNQGYKQIVQQESEDLYSQILQDNQEILKPKEEVHTAEYAEYIPVAVVTAPEVKNETDRSTQRSEIAQQLETISLNSETKEPEVHDIQGETIVSKNEKPESTEATNREERATTNVTNEIDITSTNESFKEIVTATNGDEDYNTSPEILQETTITTNTPSATEQTTNVLNKFESTLKTLVEQENHKHEEKHDNTLETTQHEATTLATSTSNTVNQEVTTPSSLDDETTILPRKFEEELQMAVKALEETTHHHFEEFENNLKETFKKFTAWGAEHEIPKESTTIFKNNPSEAKTTQQPLTEQLTTMTPAKETSQDSINVMLEETYKTKEPPRSGVINQNFVDKFPDNYQETSENITTEMQTKKGETNQLTELKESLVKTEETTETPVDMTTTLAAIEQEQFEIKKNENSVKATTMQNDVKENLISTAANFVNDSTDKTQETTTEYITESSITPLLARVPLEKDVNSISLTLDNIANTRTATQESTTQKIENEQVQEEHPNSSPIMETTELMEEMITLPTPESAQQEMVTFIEHSDPTTATHQQLQQEQKEDEESLATSQTQEPLTQASFMEEHQQQIESTTEHVAQTQTAATSGQTANTTAIDEETSEQHTTEAEIYSTTVMEDEDEMTMTTTVAPTTTTTVTPVEPEARSLSLTPPKLEYLQSEDGVEVFYGYSIVKHNKLNI